MQYKCTKSFSESEASTQCEKTQSHSQQTAASCITLMPVRNECRTL